MKIYTLLVVLLLIFVGCKHFESGRFDVHGHRGGLQAPVQRRTNKGGGGTDILTHQTSRKAAS